MAHPKDEGAVVIDLVARMKQRAEDNACPNINEDIVVRMAMDMLKIVQDETQEHPQHVLTALQVVNNTLASRYLKYYGREEFSKMVHSASIASRMYEAHYTGENDG